MQPIAEFEMPYVDAAVMPSGWLHWLAGQGSTPNQLVRDLTMEHLKAEKPLFAWNHAAHGPLPWMQFFYDWRFGDVRNDGELGFVLARGAERQEAFASDGLSLWRYDDPSAGFTTLRYDSNFALWDIDRDGRTELLCMRRSDGRLHLCIVDAETGRLRLRAPIPDMGNKPKDVRASVTVADIRGTGHASDIILSWDYYSLAVFDQDLRLLWVRHLEHEAGRTHRTMGHTPYACDIDGDGRAEVFAGSCLLNSDGTTRWVCPDLPSLCRFDHADSVKMARLQDGEEHRILMSTGAYCFDRQGRLLWGDHGMSEGQAMRLGRMRSDLPGKQVAIYEARSRHEVGQPDCLRLLDRHGNLLWRTDLVGPDMQEGGFGLWTGDWTGSGLDCVFINDQTSVRVYDGMGELIASFPGHLIQVVTGPSRTACAVVLDGIAPGFRLRFHQCGGPSAAGAAWPYPIAPDLELANATRY